ncbi:ATP-binding cassette domain-containing protein [Flavobacterium zhairuonense]|uniref:ABC transporter ATP-binding protein n=1 Tax=Flavobacterium zhairuonense TaxID=2493631 RepID=UPI00104B9F75|nr:ABC transporter ATP-binding protein [Flavobacterium zhairuonense]KAF2510798.1 ATP-binding cassette domain-containing protein [Flavobacterium zhairuonense]
MQENEVLVKAENLSKKFCKDLKTSLWYGVKDLFSNVLGDKNENPEALRLKEFWAVKDISFELRRGECLGLIGHNGAGKSTLLKILNGLINPDEGKVTMRGRVCALIELGAGFNPILTGRENIYNNGAVLGFSKAEIDSKVEEIIDFAEIREFIDMPVQNYSSGMKVRLGFAVAAQMEPDVLIIDEVLSVGDLGFRVKCMNRITELLASSAVIFVSHSMTQVTTICNEAMLLEHGKLDFYSKNVGEVVEKYFFKFQTSDEQLIGDGSIELKVFNFIENSEKVTETSIRNGEDLRIEFELEANTDIENLKFRLGFFNIEYKLLAEVDSDTVNFVGKVIEGKIKVTTVIKGLYLKYGKYSIHIHVINLDTNKKILRQSNIGHFIVKPTISIGADFLLPSEWS